ncbi:MAG TPA: sigma-70 family RNA polymerase sigma factor [Pseudobacteroides sp.]|nr:sigma-70 family RNA polymerase sigma factor [Pseudobacteroides sp.]
MKDGFLLVYDKYFDDVYRYIYFKTGNKWEADDLVSETFKKAYENYKYLKGEPKPWIMAIARNTVIDFYRRKNNFAQINDNEPDEFTYNYLIEDIFERKEELCYLKQSLKTLNKEELEIVNLRYFSDMKYNEIGKLLGKTENAVKTKAMRIHRKLAQVIQKLMEE